MKNIITSLSYLLLSKAVNFNLNASNITKKQVVTTKKRQIN